MKSSRSGALPPAPGSGAAFLLAQVGSHAAAKFAERLAPLDLGPPQAGILRAISQARGLSQQALGAALGMFASRLVLVLDELEKRGLVQRSPSPSDRRTHALDLTPLGQKMLQDIGRVAREHEAALCAALSESERALLTQFLTRIAAEQELVPGVHPGYRKLGAAQHEKKPTPPTTRRR